jgi:hypothetical protein
MKISIGAVVACVVVGQLVPMAWFMAFGEPWLALTGLADAAKKGLGTGAYLGEAYGLSILSGLVQSLVLVWIFRQANVVTASQGALFGLLIAVAFVLLETLTMNKFEMRPTQLSLIDAGGAVLTLPILGAILGKWGIKRTA